MDIDQCVSCGSGLLAVSDICPQCGWLKNKRIEIDNSEENISNDIKSNPSTTELSKIKNKIPRPTGVRLFGIFHMAFGISLIVSALIFALAVVLLVMSNGIISVDPSTLSSFDTIIELHGIVGSPSLSEIRMMMYSAGVLNMDGITEILGGTSTIAIIESILGIFTVIVGHGLFSGKKWSRILIIVSSVISIPIAVSFFGNLDNLAILGVIAFDGLVIYYMTKPKVREYFNQTLIKKLNKKSKIKTSKSIKKT